jgi:hypothetical protein
MRAKKGNIQKYQGTTHRFSACNVVKCHVPRSALLELSLWEMMELYILNPRTVIAPIAIPVWVPVLLMFSK